MKNDQRPYYISLILPTAIKNRLRDSISPDLWFLKASSSKSNQEIPISLHNFQVCVYFTWIFSIDKHVAAIANRIRNLKPQSDGEIPRPDIWNSDSTTSPLDLYM